MLGHNLKKAREMLTLGSTRFDHGGSSTRALLLSPFLPSERLPPQMFVKPSPGCHEPFRSAIRAYFFLLKTICSAPVVKDLLATVVNTVN